LEAARAGVGSLVALIKDIDATGDAPPDLDLARGHDVGLAADLVAGGTCYRVSAARPSAGAATALATGPGRASAPLPTRSPLRLLRGHEPTVLRLVAAFGGAPLGRALRHLVRAEAALALALSAVLDAGVRRGAAAAASVRAAAAAAEM